MHESVWKPYGKIYLLSALDPGGTDSEDGDFDCAGFVPPSLGVFRYLSLPGAPGLISLSVFCVPEDELEFLYASAGAPLLPLLAVGAVPLLLVVALGLLDWESMPPLLAPELDAPLAPCAYAVDAKANGIEHRAITNNFFITLS